MFLFLYGAANAGTNKAASSSTSLNTRKLDEDTENLSREFFSFNYVFSVYHSFSSLGAISAWLSPWLRNTSHRYAKYV